MTSYKSDKLDWDKRMYDMQKNWDERFEKMKSEWKSQVQFMAQPQTPVQYAPWCKKRRTVTCDANQMSTNQTYVQSWIPQTPTSIPMSPSYPIQNQIDHNLTHSLNPIETHLPPWIPPKPISPPMVTSDPTPKQSYHNQSHSPNPTPPPTPTTPNVSESPMDQSPRQTSQIRSLMSISFTPHTIRLIKSRLQQHSTTAYIPQLSNQRNPVRSAHVPELSVPYYLPILKSITQILHMVQQIVNTLPDLMKWNIHP